MLVLQRKLGEKIVIPIKEGNITITVVDISHGRIRLGIEAPGEVPVYREEIAPDRGDQRLDKENLPDNY